MNEKIAATIMKALGFDPVLVMKVLESGFEGIQSMRFEYIEIKLLLKDLDFKMNALCNALGCSSERQALIENAYNGRTIDGNIPIRPDGLGKEHLYGAAGHCEDNAQAENIGT